MRKRSVVASDLDLGQLQQSLGAYAGNSSIRKSRFVPPSGGMLGAFPEDSVTSTELKDPIAVTLAPSSSFSQPKHLGPASSVQLSLISTQDMEVSPPTRALPRYLRARAMDAQSQKESHGILGTKPARRHLATPIGMVSMAP